MLPYFFPALFAARGLRDLAAPSAVWQYLLLAVAGIEILLLIVWIPYNYFGGGGVLGNRYFMNIYGLFLFLIPPIDSIAFAIVPWLVGGLFTAQIVLNPFYSSFHPARHAKSGPLRLLPVELSLFNDLPIMTEPKRVKRPFGTEPRFQITFLDDNAYIEDNAFWVKRRLDARDAGAVPGASPAAGSSLAAGETATASPCGEATSGRATFRPGQVRHLTIPLDDGLSVSGVRIWRFSISSSSGFLPLFGRTGSTDNRYLGVRVTPELMP